MRLPTRTLTTVTLADGDELQFSILPERPMNAAAVEYDDGVVRIEISRQSNVCWTCDLYFQGEHVVVHTTIAGWWRVARFVRDRGVGWHAKKSGPTPWWQLAEVSA